MKITLTTKNDRWYSIDININTNPENNILTYLLTSEYGTMYKEAYIDGWYFKRNPDPKIYGTISISFKKEDWDEYETAYISLSQIGADLKNLSYADLRGENWYTESGEYLAVGFNDVMYAAVKIGDHTTSMAFPINDVENRIKDSNNCYLVGYSDKPIIEASGSDEACYNVWNYNVKFGETVIRVELDDNPVETAIYAIN